MTSLRLAFSLAGALAAACSTTGSAWALDYAETLNGDLSGIGFAPTPLSLDLGLNTISGRMGRGPSDVMLDIDIFTFTLDPGEMLTSINVLNFGYTGSSFYAIAPGATIDLNNGTGHLSNMLVSGPGEILDDLAAGSYSGDALGLLPPLGAGTYTIWFQELSSRVDYSIAYTVSAVPEPGTALWGACVGLLAATRSRHRRRA